MHSVTSLIGVVSQYAIQTRTLLLNIGFLQ